LLADMMHLCQLTGIDFAEMLATARSNFACEIAEELHVYV
jgi:hypothetical protein